MTDRELMQQALEVLERCPALYRAPEAATALRERLAQPEQEPVATPSRSFEDVYKVQTERIAHLERELAALRERLADSPVNDSLTTGSCIACGNRMTGSPKHFVVATAEVGVTAPEGYSPQQVEALHPHKGGDVLSPPLVNRIADILIEDYIALMTENKQLRERLAQPEQESMAWRNAALRVGEDLCSVNPFGYYDMTAQQWLDWALSVVTVHNPQPEQEP